MLVRSLRSCSGQNELIHVVKKLVGVLRTISGIIFRDVGIRPVQQNERFQQAFLIDLDELQKRRVQLLRLLFGGRFRGQHLHHSVESLTLLS